MSRHVPAARDGAHPHSQLTHTHNTHLGSSGCTGQGSTPLPLLNLGISGRLPCARWGGVEKARPILSCTEPALDGCGTAFVIPLGSATMCRSRSSLPSMTALRAPTPVPSTSPGPRRGSGPEIFTFDPLPEPAMAPAARPSASRGHRKRSRRVLYPRVVSVAEAGGRGEGRREWSDVGAAS